MTQQVVHNFAQSLALSHENEEEAYWETVYRRAFPDFEAMHLVRGKGWAQQGGVDRILLLKGGRTITVDEKVRREVWTDILLEMWSSVERQTPGWIAKPQLCDYIAYAFLPNKVCYLLPFQQLRTAWLTHGPAWLRRYKQIDAVNEVGTAFYTTRSVAVPINVVLEAITQTMSVSWASPTNPDIDEDEIPF